MSHAAIVGAGIAGLSLAKGLRLLGWTADIYEQATEIKPLGAGIALSANALKALHCLGLYRAVVARAQRIDRLSVLDQDGVPIQSTDHEQADRQGGLLSMVAIHRGDLQEALSAALPPGALHLGMECAGVHVAQNGRVVLEFKTGTAIAADIVFACDGIHSTLRKALFPDSCERFADYTCWRAIADCGGVTEVNHVTESWGNGIRFGVAPLKEGRTYWFACCGASRPDDPAFAGIGLSELQRLFSRFHAPIPELLRQTRPDALIRNDIFDIDPIPAFFKGRVAFLGDAAHAVTPDLGQGAGLAIEDAAILSALLARKGIDRALAEYSSRRMPRARRIARSSRFLGELAQLKHPLAVRLRNSLARMIPGRLLERYASKVMKIDLQPIR